ncbi:probable protein phosphatase 2C 52 isoform X1 [Phoenix dactylifera]|uniref:protein-serine/threonine phosphatase n=1 Tax=Phoenix dactylifera TaxID=42345 RepID=A0A8B9ASA8_PHODC|nr:probable protein phosphatase 2C 52 isoform X1 [Phoenix dactylifera]XP_038986234.1 probable protein phosphatase 2C 52 isoform X1 [Phoenix dactylifera]
MVCITSLRNFVVRATNLRGFSTSRQGHLKVWGSNLDAKLEVNYPKRHRMFRAITKMVVDSSATPEPPRAIINVLPKKDREDDGSYFSGGWKSADGKLSYGYSSFRGRRATMEDFYDVKISKIDGQTVSLFGIFDGHGGSRAAEYLKEHLFENLMMHPQFMTDTKLAISETYQQTDSDFLDAERHTYRDDGSTASTAVLVGNHLYVANVGDSRAVISKAGKAIPLSDDHKPNRSDERKRIEDAGGVVLWAGTWRVGGILAMSRAFGNRLLKQFVVAEPEIQEQEVHEELELLVLASDGLWDVVPNEDAVSLARMEEEPEAAARKLTEAAFSRGSADNITCIVVRFHHDKSDADSSLTAGDKN